MKTKKRRIPITIKDSVKNERGFALVTALLILAVLTLIGIAATTTSTVELKISGNESQSVNIFYNTEGVLINTLETPTTWLTTDFLTAGETVASYAATVDDNDVEIRCIKSTGTPVSGLSGGANDLPVRLHRDSPPKGSGYSMKYFEVRRYGITTTSLTGKTSIQTGVWKVFNKNQ